MRLHRLVPSLLALWLCAGCATYSSQLAKGDALIEQGSFEEAERVFREAMANEPSRKEARERLDELYQAWAQSELSKADGERRAGRLDVAAKHYLRAEQLWPASGGAELLARALDERALEGEALLGQGKWEEALRDFEAVLSISPKHPRATQGGQKARSELGRKLAVMGEAYEKKGRLGNALVAFARAEQLRPGSGDAKARAQALRTRLLEEVAFYVDTEEPVDRAGVPALADALSPERVALALPKDLPLRAAPRAPDGANGVRVRITVDTARLERDRKMVEKANRFVAGRHLAENPKWRELDGKLVETERALEQAETELAGRLAAFEEAGAELEDARNLLGRCWAASLTSCSQALAQCYEGLTRGAGSETCSRAQQCTKEACRIFEERVEKRTPPYEEARTGLHEARQQVAKRRDEARKVREARAKEPTVSEQPAYAEFPYEVELHTLTAKVGLTYVLEPLGSGVATPVAGEYAAESQDTTHRGFPMYGVRADLLSLKPEAELYREAAGKALEAVVAGLKSELDKRRLTLKESARKAMAGGGSLNEEAVETAVRAMLAFPDQKAPDLGAAVGRAFGMKDASAAVYGR